MLEKPARVFVESAPATCDGYDASMLKVGEGAAELEDELAEELDEDEEEEEAELEEELETEFEEEELELPLAVVEVEVVLTVGREELLDDVIVVT